MRIYFADIRGLDPSGARCRGRSGAPGSAFAASLLWHAARETWGLPELPEILADGKGKPYFPAYPDFCYSLSHTRTHVLCALSEKPVGADVEAIRPFPEKSVLKLTDEREREDFAFFELWVLRESLFKLTGEGSLRSLRFRREAGEIIPPVPGVRCALYEDVPGCAAAVCSFAEELPEKMIFVPQCEICT